AAVADFMVPLAFGTQTRAAQIRPASFNGIYALKPTWRAVSREAAKLCSSYCYTVGWSARSTEDLALVAQAFGLRDMASRQSVAVRELRGAVCRTSFWNKEEAGAEKALSAAVERLEKVGVRVQSL